jgi:hypothetical protein
MGDINKWRWFNEKQAWAIQMNGTLDGTAIFITPKPPKIHIEFILLLSLGKIFHPIFYW